MIIVDFSRSEPTSSPDADHTIANHVREGAFPPSTILVTPSPSPSESQQSLPDNPIRLVAEPPIKDQLPNLPSDVLDSAPPSTLSPDSESNQNMIRSSELRRERSWVSNSNDSSHISSENGRHASDNTKPELPKEMNGYRSNVMDRVLERGSSLSAQKGSLPGLKRYSSLPRTPSVRSPRINSVRSPSPEPRPRTRARSPDAMRFKDVLVKKTVAERAIGYANKINELALYDCGLGDWVVSMKERGGL